MQRLDIKLNGFHQNVREVQGKKLDYNFYVAVKYS